MAPHHFSKIEKKEEWKMCPKGRQCWRKRERRDATMNTLMVLIIYWFGVLRIFFSMHCFSGSRGNDFFSSVGLLWLTLKPYSFLEINHFEHFFFNNLRVLKSWLKDQTKWQWKKSSINRIWPQNTCSDQFKKRVETMTSIEKLKMYRMRTIAAYGSNVNTHTLWQNALFKPLGRQFGVFSCSEFGFYLFLTFLWLT